MKILWIILLLFLSTACSHKPTYAQSKGITKEPYHYPNYKIIKPKRICKPNRANIKRLLLKHIGKPYVWAEEGPDAFDCSGLTYNIYARMGLYLPRIASEQAKVGKHIPFSKVRYGDLIFFAKNSSKYAPVNHVGIYLGNGWFAHASSEDRKVTISQFSEEPEYRKRVKLCRRYMSIDEHRYYMRCNVPLKKMKITDRRYTTPWRKGMRLPRKAVP